MPLISPKPNDKRTNTPYIKTRNETSAAENALLNELEVVTTRTSRDKSLVTQVFTNGWGLEVLGWIVAALSLAAIVGILFNFNYRALPQWPYQINLNTLISIFSQISSTALLVPLTGCISQLKWLWFTRRSQPLHDFESFDSASRGPWPSFLLIWKTRASPLISLGALLVIANLAFQPFAQQAVSFPQRIVPIGNATLPTIHNITINALQGNNELNLNDAGSIPPAAVAAIYAGLNGGTNLSEVVPYCATGNCTWNLYDSLAICANPVANLTHLLTRTALTIDSDCSIWGVTSSHLCNYSLPNGAYLSGEDMFINITSIWFNSNGPNTIPSATYPGNQTLASIAFSDIPVILDFFMIYYSPSIKNVAAIEGSLSFCGQTYNTSVHRGQTNTAETQRWGQLNTSHGFGYPHMWPLVGNSTTLWVGEGYSDSLQNTLTKIFNGYYQVNDNGVETYSSVAVQALKVSLDNSKDDVATLSLFMNGIANSISNNLRTGNGSITLEGVMYGVETYVLAVWVWLALPIGIIFFTLIFILGAIQMNHGCGTKIWKSSSLAVLSGLSNQTRDELGGLTSMATVKERSEGVKARMVEDESGWKLVTE